MVVTSLYIIIFFYHSQQKFTKFSKKIIINDEININQLLSKNVEKFFLTIYVKCCIIENEENLKSKFISRGSFMILKILLFLLIFIIIRNIVIMVFSRIFIRKLEKNSK